MEDTEYLNLFPTMAANPEIYLHGENLEYYRNIEYLKEVTHQANALLDRSNAKYENILDDQKLGYTVRARSTSDMSKSLSPLLEGRCVKCGLSHGAATFCIVEQIIEDERQYEENRRSKASKGSFTDCMSIASKSPKQQDWPEPATTRTTNAPKQIWQSINVIDKMKPSQVLDMHETICARHGANAGRTFLLANSMANPPEARIQRWATLPDSPNGKTSLVKHCFIPAPTYSPLCPDKSPEVRLKMEQLLDVIPPCDIQPYSQKKNWKGILQNHLPKAGKSFRIHSTLKEDSEFGSSTTKESCQCDDQLCQCGVEKICTIPKIEKVCTTKHEDDNNYLLTMRNKLWKRRESKRKETLMFSRQSVAVVRETRAMPEEFIEKATVQNHKMINNCLKKLQTDECDGEFAKNVERVAELSAPSTGVDQKLWDLWQEQKQQQERFEEFDEVDSLPSDAFTDEENSSLISHSSVDYKSGRIKSRIPFAEEVHDLIDILYDKITRKLEKYIVKNSFKESRLSFRPTFAFLHRKMNLLSNKNPLFQEILYQARFPSYLKRLTPFSLRKSRKLKRLRAMNRKLERTMNRRDMARGLQLGKQYRKIRNSHEYSRKPQERALLDVNFSDRFARFQPLQEKAMTKKSVRHEFKQMSSMFDSAAKADREDLIDQGMLQRFFEFQKKMHHTQNLPLPPFTDTEDEEDHLDPKNRIPHKDDVRLLQKANIQQSGHLAKQIGHEHDLHLENARRARHPEAENSKKPRKSKHKRNSEYSKVERLSKQRLSRSVRSLLLPPLFNYKPEFTLASREPHMEDSSINNDINRAMSVHNSRLAAVTKFPELKCPSRKTCSKTGKKRRYEALPEIKQSAENPIPGQSREMHPGKTRTQMSAKLPLLAAKTK